MTEGIPLGTWQATLILALWLLPLYALTYPLARLMCRARPAGAKVILYAYPYAVTMLVVMGYITAGIMTRNTADEQVDAYFAVLTARNLPLILLCNAWTRRYLRRHMPAEQEKE